MQQKTAREQNAPARPEMFEVFAADESLDQLRVLRRHADDTPDIRVTGIFLEGGALLRALAKGAEPDALILNLCLLDMDALQFLKRLKALELTKRPKILITAGPQMNRNVQEELLSLWEDCCIIKTYEAASLFEWVRTICRHTPRIEAQLESLIEERLKQYNLWRGDGQWYMRRALYKTVTTAQEPRLAEDLYSAVTAGQQVRFVEDVYNAVALEAGITPGAVEASLRRTLKEIEQAATPAYRQLAAVPQSKGKKMTVGTFLNMVGQLIQQDFLREVIRDKE